MSTHTHDYPAYLDAPDAAHRRMRRAEMQRKRRRKQGVLPRWLLEAKPWERYRISRATYFRMTTAKERRRNLYDLYREAGGHVVQCRNGETVVKPIRRDGCEAHYITRSQTVEIQHKRSQEKIGGWVHTRDWDERLEGIPFEYLREYVIEIEMPFGGRYESGRRVTDDEFLPGLPKPWLVAA